MHHLVWRCVSRTLAQRVKDSKPTIQSMQFQFLNSVSTTQQQQPSAPSKDLIGSSHESSENPNNSITVNFLKDWGFSKTQIETIATKHPPCFSYRNPDKAISPKTSFFQSIGLTKPDVINLVTVCPQILERSLENHIIPSYNLLKTLMGDDETSVLTVVKCFPFIFLKNLSTNLVPNSSTLSNLGVTKSQFAKMMTRLMFAKAVVLTKPDRFSEVVAYVMDMGFDPSPTSFGTAVSAVASCSPSTWENKLKLYESLGFSEKQMVCMFRKQPNVMMMSNERIQKFVEFYQKSFSMSLSDLVDEPNVMMYSLEKRIIPRCSVLQVLVSRNKIERNLKLLSVLAVAEKDFVSAYVTRYSDEVPEVLAAYQGKLHFDEYNFGLPPENLDSLASRNNYSWSHINFLKSIGLTETDVIKLVTTCPLILERSLKKQIIPSFDLLKTILGNEPRAVSAVKCSPWILLNDISKNMVCNLSMLGKLGVGKSQFVKAVTRFTFVKAILGTKPDRFSEVAAYLMLMGFDILAPSFETLLAAAVSHNPLTYEKKLDLFESLGFSERQMLAIFRKQPNVMMMSNDRIQKFVEFYKKSFHMTSSDLVKHPNLMIYSLEKRIIPRCMVLQVLASRNRIQENFKLLPVLVLDEKDFVQTYVTKYAFEVPEVLDAYQGKLVFDEFSFCLG